MSRIRRRPPGVDPALLIKDAARLMPDATRRLFLRGGASLGALAFLTGCDIVDGPSAERALMKVSRFNDRVQAWLFDPRKPAPHFTHFSTNSGAPARPGRDASTSLTAYRAASSAMTTWRASSWNERMSAPVSTRSGLRRTVPVV